MHVLLALDVNDHADTVLADALPWIERLGAHVSFAYVQNYAAVNPYIHDPALAEAISRQWEAIKEREREQLQGLMDQVPEGLRGEVHVLDGDPASGILDLADGYDGIFIGTHGRSGLVRAWMGSVAEKVARKAQVPVTILPIDV